MTLTMFEVCIIARICLDRHTRTDEYFTFSIHATDRTAAVLAARLNVLDEVRAKYGDVGGAFKVVYAKSK